MWTMRKTGRTLTVSGNGERYQFVNQRRAKQVLEGRASGTVTREQAERLQDLDRRQYR